MSPDSVKSRWCTKELNQALSRETKTRKPIVIPLLYRDVNLPPFLEDKLYVDFRTTYLSSLAILAARIHKLNTRLVASTLVESEPKTLREVKQTLKRAGWDELALVDHDHWSQLKNLLKLYGFTPTEDIFRVIDPFTGFERNMKK